MLISVLQEMPQDARVLFAEGFVLPTHLTSYRGYYDQLVLTQPEGPEPPDPRPLTVAEMLVMLRAADGAVFEGHHGGEYLMDQGTHVWADLWGHSGYVIETITLGSNGDVLVNTQDEEGW